MGMIKTELLKIGMTLTEPVKNFQDGLILTSGTVLTEKHLKALKAWGITEVQVNAELKAGQEDSIEVLLDQTDVEMRQRIEEEVNRLFQKCDREDPVIQELMRLVVLQELKK